MYFDCIVGVLYASGTYGYLTSILSNKDYPILFDLWIIQKIVEN